MGSPGTADIGKKAVETGFDPQSYTDPISYFSGGGGNSTPHTPGDNISDAKAWAKQGFNEIFGRDPTADELAQALPAFVGTDPHLTDTTSGNAWLANYHQQQTAPTAQDLYNKQQAKYQAEAPKHFDTVQSAFKSLMGRDATQEELTHFGTLMASGQTDPYELQNYLKQTPEYANTADATFRQQLGGQLNQVNSDFFKNYIQPDVVGSFAAQGRDTSGLSSGLSFALAKQAGQMQTQTQQYLAQLGASQYGGNKAQATSDYQTQLAQQMGIQNASLGNQLSSQNNLQQQGWNSANYSRQQSDLMNYMGGRTKPQGSAGSGALQGGTQGAAIGTSIMPGWGTAIGGIGGAVYGGYQGSQGKQGGLFG